MEMKPEVSESYIGVDLDGTLALHGTTWDGISVHAPIPRMVERVKGWLNEGTNVRIITARVAPINTPERIAEQTERIEKWCEEHLGRKLPVQAYKCYNMIELWDDRAIQVARDSGIALVDVANLLGNGMDEVKGIVQRIENTLSAQLENP